MEQRTLDLHCIKHEDVSLIVEEFVLFYQGEMPLEIIYGNSQTMRELVEECLDKIGFTYNDGYENPYGRLLVIGYSEDK